MFSIHPFECRCDQTTGNSYDQKLMNMNVDSASSMQMKQEENCFHEHRQQETGIISTRNQVSVATITVVADVTVPATTVVTPNSSCSCDSISCVHKHVLQVVPVSELSVFESSHPFTDESGCCKEQT